MNVTLAISIRRLIIFTSALAPAIDVVGQGFDVPLVPASSTYGDEARAGVGYDDDTGYANVYSGYQSQSAYQTSVRRAAADDVLQNTVGYSVAAPFGPRISLDGVFGDRMGVDGNDYSVSTFMPWHLDPGRNVVFAVARGTSTDLGDFVGNFGVGQRMYFDDLNRIIGVNGWFDIDDTHTQVYYRAGAQIEYIGRYLEVRGGVDLVVQDDQLLLGSGFTNDPPFFRVNNIVSNAFTVNEFAYDQGYLEAGGPLPYIGRYGVNGYAGSYLMWHKDDEEAVGVMGRLSADLTRDLAVSMRYTNDQIFGANTSVNVSLSLPAGGIKQIFQSSPQALIRGQSPDGNVAVQSNRIYQPRQPSVARRMGGNVVREMRMPVLVRRRDFLLPEINPLDGMPIFVGHVDPNAAVQGNGTFETPFSTMEAARRANVASVDIIRVIPNSDDTGTNLDLIAPFRLFDNQRLLASSSTHTFTSTRGTFPLPSFTGAGPGPLLTNSMGGDVIQLANNNEVAGFIIDGAGTGNGIVGNLTDFNLNRNTIRNAVIGIRLLNAQGIGLIDQNTITGSTSDGVQITVTGGNTLTLTASDNSIGGNGDNGLEIMSTGNSSVIATLTGNTFGDGVDLAGNDGDGFHFTADSGTANIVIGGPNVIDGNIFIGNGDDGVDFNLTGTALATLLAQNNTTVSGAATEVGLNFTGSTFGDTNNNTIPPDTMGGVGPNHIVEFINTKFTVYNKTDGTAIQTSSLSQFFVDAGVTGATGLFDPRIVYDPQSGRWFAASIDGGTGNNIYIAVSITSDPTAGWTGFQFQGDTANARFNDFDTLGLDADGVYLSTNNFGGPSGFDVSIYSIPKADLLAATPTIANLTRFENLSSATLGSSIQPAVDFGPSDGRAALLASDGGSNQLHRTDILGASGAGSTLSGTTDITVATYTAGPPAAQPGAMPLENVSPRISSNVVEVGDSLWAVHVVADPVTGRSAIRWYEIDETTNALKQSGLITDPNLDFIDGSIAVNAAGNVVIGFTGSGANQFASSMAVVGRTGGGTTTFEAPMILQPGAGNYFVDFGTGRNRWGDYSATVVDPADPNAFWTFQEFANATDSYAIQITQVRVGGGGNGGDGISITATGNSVLTNATVDSNVLTDNAGAGLRITAGDTAVITNAVITNNTATRNGTGALLTASDISTINTTVSGNQFDRNTADSTGFYALAMGSGAVVNVNSFTNNTASNNSNGNGLRFEATDGGLLNLANFTGNTASSNGINGAFIRANGLGSIVAGSIGVSGQMINTFTSNTSAGLGFEATEGGGIFGPGGVDNFLIVNNVIGANAMGGINALADATLPVVSTLNLMIGGTALSNTNLIQGNADVGIAFSLQNSSTGQLVIENNTISDTVDDAMMATANLLGQGVYIEVAGTSTLNNSFIDANTITDNASHGIHGFVREMGVVNNLIIGNLDGDDDNGNTIVQNMGDGINFRRRDNARVINMDIFDNTIMNNMNGLNLIAQNADLLDTYDVNDNIISENTANGIRVRVEADADLDLDLDNNLITLNGGDGIETSESTNAPTDTRSVRGTWTNNVITNNEGHGIQISSRTTALFVGTAGNGNLIDMNALNGVQINGEGTATFTENMITNNGTGGFEFNPATSNTLTLNSNIIRSNMGIGFDINHSNLGSVDVFMNNNTIDLNTGDGVEINATGATSGLLTVTSGGNFIDQNLGRGVDILNQQNADSRISFVNDTITSNGLEGFYVVNTASATQNQTDPATMALLSDGALNATPTLNLTLSNSTVSFNGNSSDFAGTGLVLRVGTSDGRITPGSFTDPGGFASDGRGGVIATVVNNMFSGNFGDDVVIESFVSTVTPATTAGTWDDQDEDPADPSNDVFTITTYNTDPLARLDLTFTGNTGDSVDVTRNGAFYNNDEPEFKSRLTVAFGGTTPGGPFTSGTRRRNAQRLAARENNNLGNFLPPTLVIGASDTYLYPGVDHDSTGTTGSTFRITAGSTTTGFDGGDNFLTIFGFAPLVLFGELPFEWDVMP